jgi:hypothetical protein
VLDDASLQRYARQVLLPEIGERGQVALCSRHAAVGGESAAARALCRVYLERAGVTVREDAPHAVVVPVMVVDPRLSEAAAWLAGSWAAVEHIKQVVQAGSPGALPDSYSFATETE